MSTPKELRVERAGLIQNARKLLDTAEEAKRDLNSEEDQQYKTMMSDASALQNRIERLEEQADAEGSLTVANNTHNVEKQPASITGNQSLSNSGNIDKAFKAWTQARKDDVPSDDLIAEAQACGVNLESSRFDFQLSQRDFSQIKAADQSVGTDGKGGYTVPTGFVTRLEEAMLHYGGMLNLSEVMRTDSGNDLHFPTVNDTSNTGALLAENTATGAQDVTFAELVLGAYKYTSKLITVSHELLEDSAFNMPSYLGKVAGERLGRILNTECTVGDGSGNPNGVVTASTAGKTAAAVDAITMDEILDLVTSVDVAYRANAQFMMHDSVTATLSKLKDGNSNYLWQPSIVQGQPDRLRGYGVSINNDMASTIEASAKTILFGDFSKYMIRMG